MRLTTGKKKKCQVEMQITHIRFLNSWADDDDNDNNDDDNVRS